jgi:transcription initiation factor TFIIH subunit 4
VLEKLYNGVTSTGPNSKPASSQWACKAVFQSLSAQAKCLVMKLLFVESSFTNSDFMHTSSAASSTKACQEAWEELVSLRIVIEDAVAEGNGARDVYKLNPAFQKSLQTTIVSPAEPWSTYTSTATSAVASSASISTTDLDKFSTEKWNDVLGYVVNLLPTNALPSNILVVFVKRSGLMTESVDPATGKKGMRITARGYEFMLKDYLSQVWDFVMVAVKNSPSQEDALALLFTLSYCTAGKGYPIDALSKTQQQLVFEFSQVGIVFMPSITSPHFFPSRVAINMIFGAADISTAVAPSNMAISSFPAATGSSGDASPSQALQIIVETNNQVVAYLSNDIHLAMVQLFVDVTVRMPNMALGRITKEKVRQAFKMGIKAAQIVDFLVLHAHPHVRRRTPVIPENVTDELALWEAELQRVHAEECVIIDFREFSNIGRHEFSELVRALQASGVVMWHSEEKVMLGVTPEGVQLVRSYLQTHRH